MPPEPQKRDWIGLNKPTSDAASGSCQETEAIGGGCVLMASVCARHRPWVGRLWWLASGSDRAGAGIKPKR
jgi:hypothetical protein